MSAVEKEAAMSDFAAGRIELLVATTVIEVGVDVPILEAGEAEQGRSALHAQ